MAASSTTASCLSLGESCFGLDARRPALCFLDFRFDFPASPVEDLDDLEDDFEWPDSFVAVLRGDFFLDVGSSICDRDAHMESTTGDSFLLSGISTFNWLAVNCTSFSSPLACFFGFSPVAVCLLLLEAPDMKTASMDGNARCSFGCTDFEGNVGGT